MSHIPDKTRYLSPALWLVILLMAFSAQAELAIPGADGSDGAFAPTENTVIDLSLAPTAVWNSPGAGHGVYDPDKWAVVFKYSSVTIPAGVTVSFKNHDSRAPVVWLVSGDTTITGTVTLNGQNYVALPAVSEGGPGGFQGGNGTMGGVTPKASEGFGFGGGSLDAGGNHATIGGNNPYPAYGNPRVFPLVGGSGGGGSANKTQSGAGGGGALLIATAGTLSVEGVIEGEGGIGIVTGYPNYIHSGGGAGGAIRLIADSLTGNGQIYTQGNYGYSYGGNGRIRLEANHSSASLRTIPDTTLFRPDDPVLIWPPAKAPSVRITSIAEGITPTDPHARLEAGREDLTITLDGGNAIILETENVDPTAVVKVRITSQYGESAMIDAVFQSGDRNLATWTATTDLPEGSFFVQAQAVNPTP